MPNNNAIALSGQYHKATLDGVDISAYIDEIRFTYQRDNVDVTTFRTGGQPTSRANIRGSKVSDVSLRGPYTPEFAKALEPLCGSRTGGLLKVYGGSNTLPAAGDEVLVGYFSVFGFEWSYTTANKSQLTFDMKIPDGATTVNTSYGV